MKIAFAAMSGIRVCDEELLRLGLTLPGFVERSKTIASLPSLGLLTLAGMTPAKHDIEYVEVPEIGTVDERLSDHDLVVISSYSAQINEAYELAGKLKKHGVATVIGGPHVTVEPEEALVHCDAVAIGEGEACWSEILADAEAGRLQRKYGVRESGWDLSSSPMPAFDLLDITQYNRLTVQTSRGCPHRCEFCAGSVLLTNAYKQKPIANVLKEIDKILEIWEHPFLEFADDNSFVNRAYWKELLPELKKRNIRWFTETDIAVAEDEEFLGLLRDSGCAQILIGFESPTEDGLCGLELRNDWKHEHFASYKKSIRTIQSNGVTVNGCFVLGLDRHTPEIFDQVYNFVRDSELYEVQITLLTPFPGTPLYERLESEGRILNSRDWTTCTLFDVNFQPQGMTVDELQNGFRELAVKLYSDEITHWRRSLFRKRLAESHRAKRRN